MTAALQLPKRVLFERRNERSEPRRVGPPSRLAAQFAALIAPYPVARCTAYEASAA